MGFEEVYDFLAVRIISDSDKKKEKEDCWRIYSIVTDIYHPNRLHYASQGQPCPQIC